MLGLHAAQRKDACQFKLPHWVSLFLAKVLSLKLYAHSSHVLDCLFDELLDFGSLLLSIDCDQSRRLDESSEHAQTAHKVTLSGEVDSFGHLIFQRAD